ncbi:P-selectin [Lamellibrachia satsuma]|nr:P-selectin [Lamellibrachia satsuma]
MSVPNTQPAHLPRAKSGKLIEQTLVSACELSHQHQLNVGLKVKCISIRCYCDNSGVITCPPIVASDVEIYNNNTCTMHTKVYNDTCEVSCKLGYNLTSSDGVHRCTEHGIWSNNVTCEVVTCPPLILGEAEIYSNNNNTCTTHTNVYNNTCQVSCEVGYNLTSSDGVHRCTEHGTWSNVTCKHITCEALLPDQHGKYTNATCTEQKTFYNDSCELECNYGYVTSGNPVRTCQLNGNWSSHIHCIEVICPDVNDSVHAQLTSGNAPFTSGTVLQYECSEGYERANGLLQLLCQKDGQWSGKAPNCTAIKCPVMISPNNTEVVIGDPDEHIYNTMIGYRCSEGHDLMFGDLSRTCQSIVSCGPLAPVANAHASMTDDTFLANITYECKPGFNPEPGSDWTRQCQADKRWSGSAPLCVEILCKAPPVVVNTSMTVDGVRVNDTVTYSCLAGYRRQAGNLTKVCNESGQWQNDDPQCIEVHCGPPIMLAHTNFSTSGGDAVGGKVMYTCIHGYQRQSGLGFSRCPLTGIWTMPTLICEEVTCGMPAPVKNAIIMTSCVHRGCVANYHCDIGYKGDSRKSRCMVDGQWSHVTVNCSREQCGAVTLGKGAVVTDHTGDSYEDTVTVTCRRGYHRVTGSLLTTCLGGGAWSGTPLVCAETTCLAPANVIGAKVSIGILTVGSNVTYQPQDTYHHVGGDLVRTCREDKLWSGKQPVFEEITCPAIQIGEDSKLKFFTDGIIIGSHVTYSCVTGYRLSAGDATCECLISGKWSCGPPTCTRVTCGPPPTVANSRNKTTGLRYLDTATYTCESGYVREGPQHTLLCSEHAHWEGDETTCTGRY